MSAYKNQDLNKWYRNFEDALKGWRNKLALIAPEGADTKALASSIDDARNSARRDVFARNVRVGFDDTTHTPVIKEDGLLPHLQLVKSASTYSEADFRQSDATDMEGVYLDSLQPRQRTARLFLTPTELTVGTRVVIWIKDHFYENQTAVVVGYRELTKEYLVEIISKRPYKRGHTTNPGAKGQMYVKLQDVKLCRRKG